MRYLRFGSQVSLVLSTVWLAACSSTPTPAPTAPPAPTRSSQDAYPGLNLTTPNYPGPTLVSSQQTPVPPTDLPTPGPGKATVAGVLYSFTIKALVPGTLIYLTPAVGPDKRGIPTTITGPSDTPGSVRGDTNERAQFILTNVPPGNYYLVVASPLTWNLGASASDEKNPMLIEVKANQTLSLDAVHVSWP